MLKSLELFGFKSFADRTRFDFSAGITGIVGPNGSGKSNVVDAIKWILGDQSAKSLRGKEMADVIFNGALGRKASSLAEATLTFDNSNGFLPIESQEVQVGRRLWRGGDAEYLINGAPARLKDIRELLMGSGAGSAAYSIIEQGRVDQILQASATSRRAIFEEAAGISRYKARKIEAERKLERVDQNLLRLTDIVDEVEAQLNSIRSQAVKAAKYREISEQLRELWLGLSADDFRRLSAEARQIEQTLTECKSQLERLSDRLSDLERSVSAVDIEIADVDDRLREVERQSASNRESMAGHESTVRHQAARQRELEEDLVRLRRQRATMASRAREVIGELEHTKGQLELFEQDFKHRKAELDVRENRIRDLANRIKTGRTQTQSDRRRLIDRARQVSELGNHLSTLQSQLQAAQTAKQSAEKRLAELDQQLAECEADCRRRLNRADQAHQQVLAVREKLREIQEQQESLIRQQGQFQQTLARQREQRSAWKARQSVLEDLENRQEGVGIGVKEILNRAKTAGHPPWNRIHGSVADLLEVDLEQAALLEVALGSRAQLIVLEKFDSLIEYLNRRSGQISGRVGFVAHSGDFDQPRIDPATLPDLSGQPGVLNRADRLVQACKKVPRLPQQLLADTWVVETLDIAMDLSRGCGRGCRFVTLQGEMLESDGTLFVGTIRSESALLSRKSELRRLKNDLRRCDRQIADEQRRLSSLGDSMSETDAQLEATNTDMQKAADQHAELKSELVGRELDLERLRRDRASLKEEIAQIALEQEQFHCDLQTSQMEVACAEEDLQSLETNIDNAERELARSQHRLQTLKQRSTTEQLELVKQEERLNGLRTAYQRIQQDQQQRILQKNEAERRLDIAISQRRKIVLHILNAIALLAELALNEEQFARQAAALLVEKEKLRARRTALVQEEAGFREQRRKLNEEQHREEIKLQDIRHQVSTLEKRIEEEYQLVLSDVVASGASAMRLYRAEKQTAHEKSVQAVSPDRERELQTAAEFQPDALKSDEVSGSSPLGDNQASTIADADRADTMPVEQIRDELETRLNRLRRKLKHMGNVNTDSLRDLDELERRYGRLSAQLQDLVEAKNTLEAITRRINAESKRLFTETFESIRVHFRDLFRKAFGGGDGDIVLEDPEDVLECGIDIVARPPGKELKSISLMSGGEKTLTAFSLLLAMFRSSPSPYCLLDEVDAALDEANVGRMLALLEEFKQTTQFVLITHQKPTMTIADVLYGVTMEQAGVSKRMSVRFEDVRENGEFDTIGEHQSIEASTQQSQNKNAA